MNLNNNSWQDDTGVEDDLIGQEDPKDPGDSSRQGYPSEEDELCRFATRQASKIPIHSRA
jgi:hypothetical protein